VRARWWRRLGVAGCAGCIGALALVTAAPAGAHELKPSLLSLEELGSERPGEYDVTWRVPLEAAGPAAPLPIFPPGTERLGDGARTRQGDVAVDRFRVRVAGGLAGKTLDLGKIPPGTAQSVGEVLVRIATADGRTVTGRILPGKRGFVVPRTPTAWGVAVSYLELGVEHILGGIDHLAFVLGLILLTPSWRKLWRTITAFTVAHSLTLGMAALGVVHVPSAPVEATIALSILFVAREVYRSAQGRPGPMSARPWTVAFGFGLLHGLGFAGALAEVGLPETDIPLALLTFNLGVELGQLLFVAVVLLLGRGLGRLLARVTAVRLRTATRLLPAYAIGTLAAFWCVERIARFF
jgi:hydrogenase/urease accessory protein HupE